MNDSLLSKQQLDQLSLGLPLLRFSPEADSAFAQSVLAQAYLDFYGINFHKEMTAVGHGFGCIDSGEFNIAVNYWLPTTSIGTLFLVHGFYDHTGLYGHIIRAALERGYAVVIYDLPGHGLSSGKPAAIDSFSQYTAALRVLLDAGAELFPQPWSIAGQSTGAAVVLDHLWRCRERDEGYPFSKTILLAPLVRPCGWKKFGWSLPLLKRFTKGLKRNFALNSHDKDFLDFIATKDPLQAQSLPLVWLGAMKQWLARVQGQVSSEQGILILQGDADATVDWRFNLEVLQQKFPSRLQLKIVTGARHHLVCEAEEWRQQVFEYVFEYLQD